MIPSTAYFAQLQAETEFSVQKTSVPDFLSVKITVSNRDNVIHLYAHKDTLQRLTAVLYIALSEGKTS